MTGPSKREATSQAGEARHHLGLPMAKEVESSHGTFQGGSTCHKEDHAGLQV